MAKLARVSCGASAQAFSHASSDDLGTDWHTRIGRKMLQRSRLSTC